MSDRRADQPPVKRFQTMEEFRADLNRKQRGHAAQYANNSPQEAYSYKVFAIAEDDGDVYLVGVQIIADGKNGVIQGSPEQLALLFESAAARIRATWLVKNGDQE